MTTGDVVREMFAAFEADGVDGALNHFAPDAMLVVGPETSAEPDTYQGVAGGRRYFEGFEGALDEVRFELLDVLEERPGAIIGNVKLSGVGAATRIPVEQVVLMTFEVSDDKLARVEAHPTIESARAELADNRRSTSQPK
jgi:ketosteroid isomerase-like protein